MFLRRALPILALAFISTFGTAQQTATQNAAPTAEGPHPAIAANYGKLPLSFEANAGQSDRAAKFLARGNGYAVFLTDKEAVLALSKGEARRTTISGKPVAQAAAKTDVVRLQLAGANSGLKVSGEEPLPGTANYFIGNDPAKWHSNVPTYAKVKYADVYPGVDLVYYGSQRQLEYDFVVAPGADAGQVRLRFAGAERLTLNSDGDLTVAARHGEITFHKPVVYQVNDGKRVEVEGRFDLLAGNKVGFSLGSYDKGRELVIDPVLEYSTYLGGAGNDAATAITVDSTGSAYVTGFTLSSKFPISSSPYQNTNGNTTYGVAFVTKLNGTGSGIVYSTYLGGNQGNCRSVDPNLYYIGDRGEGITVDGAGEAYVVGTACSTNFPAPSGAYQPHNNGANNHVPNAFVSKLNATGTNLVYSTYFGGSGSSLSGDFGHGIAVDSSGNAYIAGETYSHDFPYTPGAFQTTNYTYQAGFVAKLNSTGSARTYATYLGGTSGNGSGLSSIAIDAQGDAYVTGGTFSTTFPSTSDALLTKAPMTGNSGNAVVTKINPSGSALVYSTYLGGAGNGVSFGCGDSGSGIFVDSADDIYVAGSTCSTNFPVTSGAFQKTKTNANQWTGFVTKFNPAGSALVYSTYLGGSGGDFIGRGLAVSPGGEAYVTGYTYSYASTGTNPTTGFPVTSGAYQTANNATANKGSNAFFTEINPAGSALVYSTYLGGSGQGTNGDRANGIAIDSDGSAYLAGYAYSLTDFPHTSSAFQTKSNATAGNSNAFVAKFAFQTASAVSLVSDGNPQKLGVKVTFTADVTGQASSGAPTGTVGFSVDGGTAVKVAVDSTGHAGYATTTLAAGVHSVKAVYSGDGTHLAGTSNTVSETIYGAISTLTVVSGSGQSGQVNTAYKLPLVVVAKDAKGDVIPGLTVTWSGTGLKFSSSTSVTGGNGQASVTATPTTSGSLTATATSGGLTATLTLTATNGTVATPSVSQTITIGDATAGATVYYTTNGTTPTTASTKYTGPIMITATKTLKFIAVLPGSTSSAVRTVTDTVK